jgi:hypothetical protein
MSGRRLCAVYVTPHGRPASRISGTVLRQAYVLVDRYGQSGHERWDEILRQFKDVIRKDVVGEGTNTHRVFFFGGGNEMGGPKRLLCMQEIEFKDAVHTFPHTRVVSELVENVSLC